jgi:hypothetical protein
MKKGINSGSSEEVDDKFRLQSCLPLNFFAVCVVSAVEEAGLEDEDDEEEEEEEDDEEEVDALGKVKMNFAVGSTFINCL